MEIHVTPTPRWAIELRNTRALHGMVSTVIGKPHDPLLPGFVLIPWPRGCGWSVYVPDDTTALELAGRVFEARLFDRPASVRFSGLHRVKVPEVRRGRQTLVIDTITPVVLREGDGALRTKPTAANLKSTLATWLPSRLGVQIESGSVETQVLSCETMPETVPMGGKHGNVRGFTGQIVLECNAVAAWLIRGAETVGMGGRTAFGFGRIRVTEAV